MVSSSNSPPRRRARPSPPGWPRSSRQSSSWSRRGRTTPPASGVRPPRHVRRRRRRLPPRRTGPSPPSPVAAPVSRTSAPARPPAPTYFVSAAGSDSNPGTSAGSPFRTLQKAADLVGPGDVVAVMNGTYTEPRKGSNVLTIKRSGRPGASITFTVYPGPGRS
ncbi:DUF1565 domain-containing protein [Streptomyces sp. NPDC060085]|uniref:right-handed parallel beta-helix repeat-containing protein n=1 Tax=Streptomyces sp. NPDC060085 TaxID=3347054 RepID=UPI003649FDFD